MVLSGLDAYRVFGLMTPPPEDKEPNWREIRERALEGLAQSRDFRVLCHLAAAVVRTDGDEALASLSEVVKAAATWLETWWDQVYPRIDDDAILRKNALSGFADRIGVVDGVRRMPLLVNRQLGSFSIRQIEIAKGQLAPGPNDNPPPDEAQLNAILTATETAALKVVVDQLATLANALDAIEKTMRERGGGETPDFTALTTVVARTRAVLAAHLEERAPAEGATEGGGTAGAAPAAGGAIAVGSIRSRDDAVRALDAVATFFSRNEPSSPIPMLLGRAKRLVAKDFLAVLEDIAPDALTQARAVGGVRDSNE